MKKTNLIGAGVYVRVFLKGVVFALGLLTTAIAAVTVTWNFDDLTGNQVVSASGLNQRFTALRTAIAAIPDCSEYSVRLGATASQILPNGTPTAIVWDVETFDSRNMHSGNDAFVTIQAAGKYIIMGRTSFNPDNNGFRNIFLQIDGITVSNVQVSPAVGNGTFLETHTFAQLSAGQTVRLMASQNSGGPLGTSTVKYDELSLVRICGG